MSKESVSLAKAISMINDRLIEYMDLKGIRERGRTSFRCPNTSAHQNNDDNYSAGIFETTDGRKMWRCHGCGAGSDTIAMAHVIDNLSMNGPGFISETLPKLIDELNLNVNISKRDPLYDIYAKISSKLKPVKEFRNIPDKYQTENGIGILDYEEARSIVKDMPYVEHSGFGPGNNDLNDTMRKVFNNRIVFTIYNAIGLPCAFAGRRLDDSTELKKWINSHNSKVFKKGAMLYGIHIAAKNKDTGNVYIVEGYTDVCRMHLNGHPNTVGIMGSGLSKLQADKIAKYQPRKVIISLDNDPDTSMTKKKSFEAGLLLEERRVKAAVKMVPEVGYDPDNYIDEFGVEKFDKLPEQRFLTYAMSEMITDKRDYSQIIEYMTWVVDNYSSDIIIEDTMRDLAKYTEYSESALINEITNVKNRLMEEEDTNIRMEIDNLASKIMKEPVGHCINMVTAAANKWTKELGKRIVSSDVQANEISALTKKLESTAQPLDIGMPRLTSMIKVSKYRPLFMIVAGDPNVGKSVLMRQFTYNILASEENENVSVLYYTIDDDVIDVASALSALAGDVEVDMVRFPSFVAPQLLDERKEDIEKGKMWVENKIRNTKLSIRDSSNVPNMFMLSTYVESIKRETGNHVVIIIDSMHSVIDMTLSNAKDPRMSAMSVAHEMSELSLRHDATVITICEFHRSHRTVGNTIKPTLANISETVKIEYLAKVGLTIHDPRVLNPETAWTYPSDRYGDLPYLELCLRKNKTGGIKDKSIFMKLQPYYSRIEEISAHEEIEKWNEDQRKSKEEVNV